MGSSLPIYVLVAATLLALALLLFRLCQSRSRGGGALGSLGGKQSGRVVLIGPSGGGKTALLHQVMRGKAPATVTSLTAGSIRGKPFRRAAEAGSVPSVCLWDYPGHPQLLSGAIEAAGRAAGVVFVVDGSAAYDSKPGNHWRAAAECVRGGSSMHGWLQGYLRGSVPRIRWATSLFVWSNQSAHQSAHKITSHPPQHSV